MRNIISFMHISLDGFVAGPGGEMDWIKVNEDIFEHVGKRIAQTDTALYGRHTYDMMESYWPGAAKQPNASRHDIEHSRWYSGARKIVLSKTMKKEGLQNTRIIGSDLSRSLSEIKQEAGNEILLFGSPSATHALMQLNLIDGFWLFVNPVVLGRGIPLFADIIDPLRLQLRSSCTFTCGVTELDYTVEKS